MGKRASQSFKVDSVDDCRLWWHHMLILANIIFTGHWLMGRCRVKWLVELLSEVNFQDTTIILVRPLKKMGRLRRWLHNHGIYVAIIRQGRKGVSWLWRSIRVGILTAHWMLKEGCLVRVIKATLILIRWSVAAMLIWCTSCSHWTWWQSKVLSNLTRAVLLCRIQLWGTCRKSRRLIGCHGSWSGQSWPCVSIVRPQGSWWTLFV